MKQVLTRTGPDAKVLQLEFKGETGNSTMEIRYTRRHEQGR